MESSTPRYNNHHYNPDHKPLARNNRKTMTKAEVCIWKYVLSNKQLMGYRFLRQRPIGDYIADFFCKELGLIIEVDGLSHQFEEVHKKDGIRTAALEKMGFTLIRFRDDEVLNDMENVERTLVSFIEEYNG